jgi:outer membrane protein assembly factor BamB
MYFAVNADFAHAPRDELRVLRAEIEYKYCVMLFHQISCQPVWTPARLNSVFESIIIDAPHGARQMARFNNFLKTMRYLLFFSLFILGLTICGAAPKTGKTKNQTTSGALRRPLTVRWQFSTRTISGLTPALYQNMLYLPLANGELVALRADDGQLSWRAEIGGRFTAAPLADARAAYTASAVIDVKSTDVKSDEGKNGAKAEAGKQTPSPSAPSAYKGFVRALAVATGVTLWTRPLDAPLQNQLIGDERQIYGEAADGSIYAISKNDGAIAWCAKFARPFVANLFLQHGRLYALDAAGTLYALDAANGTTLWRYQTHPTLRGALAVANEIIFFGASDGQVFALRAEDGKKLWRARTGGGVMALTPTREGLLVASLDNFAYLLGARNGNRIWKTQLAGRIEAAPLVADDAALFAPLSGDACVALSLRDGKPFNSLPVGEENNTAAAPLLSEQTVIITTRSGLLAFAPVEKTPLKSAATKTLAP